MNASDAAAEAVDIVTRLPEMRRTHAFVGGVDRFVTCLRTIPDNPPSDDAPALAALLRREADRMIGYIEERIEGGGDGAKTQQQLASSIYAVQAAMEQIEVWHRHYRERQ